MFIAIGWDILTHAMSRKYIVSQINKIKASEILRTFFEFLSIDDCLMSFQIALPLLLLQHLSRTPYCTIVLYAVI